MDDLVPFLFFLVIVAVNVVAGIVKTVNSSPKKETSGEEEEDPFRRFFRELVQEINPPREVNLPEWPEGVERPDYIHEVAPVSSPESETEEQDSFTEDSLPVKNVEQDIVALRDRIEPIEVAPVSFSSPRNNASLSSFSGSHGLRMPSLSQQGTSPFQIKGKRALRKAMRAHILFSPPKALEPFSFSGNGHSK